MREFGWAIVVAVVLLMAHSLVRGAEPVKEMSMATEVGEVVLTVEPCPLNPNNGFEYLAYATEKGQPDHMGCWNTTEAYKGIPSEIVNVWFPEINAVASYHMKLFKPRVKV